MKLSSYERVLLLALVATVTQQQNMTNLWLYYDWNEFLSDTYTANGVTRIRPTEVAALRNIHRQARLARDRATLPTS